MTAQATVPLEKAKRLEPDKASIREALGIAYFRLRRWDEAESEFRAVLELSPTDDYAHYALGRVLEKQGRDAEANGHYKLASSMKPAERELRRAHPRARVARGVRAVVQRVSRARVTPGGEIGAGLCVLLGVAEGDDAAGAERLAGKVARLRIFEDDDGKFDRSLLDTGGAALVVSQFTLIADTARRATGRASPAPRVPRPPSRCTSASATRFAALGVEVATGVFGARMSVELVNDGPVTIVLDD